MFVRKEAVGSRLCSDQQLALLESPVAPKFPATRYQGSKAKLAGWIWQHLASLDFDSVLDAFGGTGCIAHLCKRHGKAVTYNDVLLSNYLVGLALVENENVQLSERDVESVCRPSAPIAYPDFIRRTFHSIYFTDDENAWLDMAVTNIRLITDCYKRALAFFALFQACLAKRPYNLFHRKNLYLRMSDVPRSFGNKATWDTAFEAHFRRSARAANHAVFSNGRANRALNCDAASVPGEYDLVYVDTPYISRQGVGVDYLAFYHFLEGLADYDHWPARVDYRTKHRAFKKIRCDWCDPTRVHRAFDSLFERFHGSTLVVSYREDGIPSIAELASMLRRYKSRVDVAETVNYRYVLSKRQSAEVLLIAR